MTRSSTDSPLGLSRLRARIASAAALAPEGRVLSVGAMVIEANLPGARVGELVEIGCHEGSGIAAEVVALRGDRAILSRLEGGGGVGTRCWVRRAGGLATVGVGEELLGRVIDGRGRPIDGGGPIATDERWPLDEPAPAPLSREPLSQPLPVGIRAIDALLTIARGQRVGILAGAGVGKSTTLALIANATEADIIVLGLIGERGREVVDFVERVLGPAVRERTVIVVATSDVAPSMRVRAAHVATAIAESFRAKRRQVLLLVDSLTRYCSAQREIGLAAGELPVARGYPPSVFAALPRLTERAGRLRDGGSVTAIYSVLVEGDDLTDPVADAALATLDGHIVLSRELANRGLFPAIDVLASASRVMPQVIDEQHLRAATRVRKLLAVYRETNELVQIGAYTPGAKSCADEALRHIDSVEAFLRQESGERSSWLETMDALKALVAGK